MSLPSASGCGYDSLFPTSSLSHSALCLAIACIPSTHCDSGAICNCTVASPGGRGWERANLRGLGDGSPQRGPEADPRWGWERSP